MDQVSVPAVTDTVAERVISSDEKAAVEGVVRWDPVKSFWWTGMLAGWLVLGSLYASWSAVAVFFLLSGLTLCLGHSLGMHRKLIHQSYEAPRWLEYVFVYLGTLVGLGGPKTMMMTHDIRDWAQQMPVCHPYFSHRNSMLKDFWWQVHCRIELSRAPAFRLPQTFVDSRFYAWLEATSLVQQVPLAVALYAMGGWGWVAWGICARVCVSIFGHWIVGHIAHTRGPRHWHVQGASAQGFNVPGMALLTFGECWHNNHHAFPGSAKLSAFPGEWDPGWTVLTCLERLDLVWDRKTQDALPPRGALVSLEEGRSCPSML